MAEFKLGRIKFVFQGAWDNATAYIVDDVVTNGGKTYICTSNHTSSTLFATDYNVNPEISKWDLAADGTTWTGDWAPSTYYNVGGMVKYGSTVYVCNEAHTSDTYTTPTYYGLEADSEKWDTFATSFDWKNSWATATRYKVNDLVSYGGYTYVCNEKHISSTYLETDITSGYWDTFNAGIVYAGEWSSSSVRYKLNDVVKYGADLWICTVVHVSSATFDSNKFSVLVNGFQFENTWSGATTYQIGDIVAYGGYTYTAVSNNINQNPSTATSIWKPFTTGFSFQGDWLVGTTYKIGEVVRLGGYTYVATADGAGHKPPNGSYWQRLNSGVKWTPTSNSFSTISSSNIVSVGGNGLAKFDVTTNGTTYAVSVHSGQGGSGYALTDTLKILGTAVGGISPANDITLTVTGQSSGAITSVDASGIAITWKSGVTYVLGDVVLFGANSYICIDAHVASSPSRPDNDSTGIYWNLLAAGTEQAVMTTQGDMFFYGNNGTERLPIGSEGQILRVQDQKPTWSYYGLINNLVYVAPTGTDSDAPGYGLSIDTPWNTVRFACEQIEKGYLNRQATKLIQKNKQFVLKEVNNYLLYTYKVTTTGTSAGAFTTASTSGLVNNMPIRFTNTNGGVSTTVTYYIKAITTNTSFTISTSIGGTAVFLSGSGANSGVYYYDQDKAERDAGYVFDGVVHDLSHGGTLDVTTAVLAYYTSAGTAYINSDVENQIEEFTAGQTYMASLLSDVLDNTAPASNYQTLNSASTVAEQIIDTALTPESGSADIVAGLMSIVTTGLVAGVTTSIPTAIQPNTTVSVKTGTYNEVLPIVIPRFTAIVGDELRSTVIQPKKAIASLADDKDKTISALNRIKDVIPDLIQNNAITPTTGNTQTQITSLPDGSVGNTTAASSISVSAELIQDIISNGITEVPAFVFTNPTGYNVGFLAGYGDGKAQIVQNYAFIKDEIASYLNTNYNSVWTDLGATGQASCTRDVGYILDALQHDMTYGGNIQSLIVGSTYYSFSQLVIGSVEYEATVAAYTWLKSFIDNIVRAQTSPGTWTKNTSLSQVTSGTAGSAGAATFAQNRVQDIIDWISNNSAPATILPTAAIALASSDLQTSFNALQAKRTEIQSDTVVWVKKFYQDMDFNSDTCYRDAGLIVDALSYDLVLGTNFNSIIAGMSYARVPAAVVLESQLEAEINSISFIKYKAKAIASGGAVAELSNAIDDITSYIDGGAVPRLVWPDYTGVDTENAAAAKLIWRNKAFIEAETIAYISQQIGLGTTGFVGLVYSEDACSRDVGLIVDALRYDLTYGGNFATRQAGLAYYSQLTSALQIDAADKTATLAAYANLKTMLQDIANGGLSAYTPIQVDVDYITGTAGDSTSSTTVGSLIDGITATITALGSAPAESLPSTSWVASTLTSANSALQAARTTIRTSVISYIATNFPALDYDETTCSRDVGYIIDAVGYDLMFNSNFRSVKAGMSYYQAQASLVLSGQKEATISAFNYLKTQIEATIVNATALARASANMQTIIDIVDKGLGETPEVHGTLTYNNTLATINGVEILRANREFLAYEASAWIEDQFPTYTFDATSCRRDMLAYVDALVYDLQYTGNYKSLSAATLYNNAVGGSEKSDMFWVSNGSGLRNCTLSGLRGSLTNANSYGTKRPTAGAFVALNQGFGPNDSKVWVNTRSHYSQNVTMFGTACTGAKIDAALHAGGNKSMVKNDFTTILSDGIGVWCTGSGSLTELVSVFNYYGYAGYLAELGGRIRATNGNSSYGTYGVIAEGTDTYETPIYATLDNRGIEAYITNVVTDGINEILRFEYANAGEEYSNAVPSINGSGYNATAVQDEFRDAAVFETRIVDLNDGNGEGGTAYVTQANVAQEGTDTQITIAATDTALTNAYAGMRVQIIAGTGVGQYGNILTYANGTKIAKIYSDSFGSITITGSTTTVLQAAAADVGKLYVNMPLYFTATTAGSLTANTLYYVESIPSTTTFKVKVGTGGSAITGLTATSGVTITMYKAGWDHAVPGTTISNVLDLTTSYVIEPRISYSAPGYTATARSLVGTAQWQSATFGANKYVAIANGSTTTSYSSDGKTWLAGGVLPASTHLSVVYGGGEGAVGTAVIGGLGGSGAVLTAVVGTGASNGQIVSITVEDGGYNFTTVPVITITGGGGFGATATATILDGRIQSINLSINGSGYTSVPTVNVITTSLTTITANTWGKNYYSTPTVTIAPPFTATAWSSGGSATSGTYYSYLGNYYRATGNGTFTTSGPTHTTGSVTNGTVPLLYTGTLAVATANLTNYGVSSYTIVTAGYGYSSIPAVTVLDTSAKFVAIRSGASATSAYSTVANLGSSWTAGNTLASKTDLAALSYGGGVYVAVGGTSGTASAVSSTDGITWIDRSSAITSLSGGSYGAITYGNGTFIAINYGGIGTSWSNNGVTWTAGGNLPNVGSNYWTSITYGNGRFVAIQGVGGASTSAAYSIDKGLTWIAVPAGLGSSQTWQTIRYGQGLFFAVASGGTVAATSPDGINWTQRTMPGSSTNWKALAFGNVGSSPLWIAASNTSGTTGASIKTGAQALGRMKVVANTVTEIRMVEPGSAYPTGSVTATTATTNIITTSDTTNLVALQPVEFTGCTDGGLALNTTYYVVTGSIVSNTSFKVATSIANASAGTAVTLTTTTGLSGTYRTGPSVTITDPNHVIEVNIRVRSGNGVLGNPSFSNRGSNNATATASMSGDGYSDIYQNTSYINVANLYSIPTAGSNVQFASVTGTNQWYKLVSTTNVLGVPGNYTATFQINPALTTRLAPAHGDQITTRLAYSQVRLTGHDFLYIGVGNQTDTNYPYVDPTNAIQANQQLSAGGGRVFFTSTDQDGNFNVGNLFGVQQATGTATLNASAFNLAGLQSLQLGAVTLGVGSAVITQFSTDPYFTANSDGVVPTQRAIKAFITSQIGGGQSSLNVNTLTAGQIYIAGNSITNTTGSGAIYVTSKMNFTGGIDGSPVALAYFGQR